MPIRSFLVLAFLPILLCADLIDHLKKAENKGSIHSLRNIDFIYIINLDERPEKWHWCNSQLNPYGIFPYRFSAVNGWKLSFEAINDVGVNFQEGMQGGFWGSCYLDESLARTQEIIEQPGRTYFSHGMARGPIGIVLSHLSVLKDALDSGYETIWVMEDDIELADDPMLVCTMIDKLDELVGVGNWDVLFTDRDTRGKSGKEVPARGMVRRPNFNPDSLDQYYVCERVSPDFIRLGARFGAYSMILRRSGIEKIFNFINEHKVFFPYDFDYYLPPQIKIYTVAENIVMSLTDALSDNSAPRYKPKIE